jgi:23S rRNA (cytosine1962-C5)-methyltransferase
VDIREHHCRFRVDVRKGQKTGFYLDQRENRFLLGGHGEGKRILDCFCYTGAFSIYGGSAKARELTLIDSSAESLTMAEEHFDLNGLRHVQPQLIRGDAFEAMRELKPGYDIVT